MKGSEKRTIKTPIKSSEIFTTSMVCITHTNINRKKGFNSGLQVWVSIIDLLPPLWAPIFKVEIIYEKIITKKIKKRKIKKNHFETDRTKFLINFSEKKNWAWKRNKYGNN